jgi:hypothetical protein
MHLQIEIFFRQSRQAPAPKRECDSHRKRAGSVVALACDLHILGSRFLTGLTAVLVASLHQAAAW